MKLWYFFYLEKINKENAFASKFLKISKGPSFHCQKHVDQKYLWRSRTSKEPSRPILKKDGNSIRFLKIAIWNMEKWKKSKLKNKHFRQPVNRKPSFFTNWISCCQITFFSYYAFSINQMSDLCEVWKY